MLRKVIKYCLNEKLECFNISFGILSKPEDLPEGNLNKILLSSGREYGEQIFSSKWVEVRVGVF